MDNELLDKLDNIINKIDNSYEANEITKVKSILLNNKELLNSIDSIKNSSYSKEYVDSKKELLENIDYKKYKELEFEFLKFSNNISKKLNTLTKQVINLKIISGKLKGRVIKGFDIDGTRPTMDRVKESLFSSIQNYIPDSICLDLFSGSGNLGFEALSNNSKHCYSK